MDIRQHPARWLVVPAALLAIGIGAGCSSSDKKAINETVARNTVAVAAKKAFDDHGYSIDGLPTCKARSTTTTKAEVACTGRTDHDEPIALLGKTKDVSELRGNFVGTVAGRTVFTTTCLGC